MLQWLLSCQTTGYVPNKFSWKSCVVLCFFTWSTSCFVWWTFCDALKEGKLELFFIVYKSLLTIRRRKMGNLNGLLYWCWYREIQKKKQDESTLACTFVSGHHSFRCASSRPNRPMISIGLVDHIEQTELVNDARSLHLAARAAQGPHVCWAAFLSNPTLSISLRLRNRGRLLKKEKKRKENRGQ